MATIDSSELDEIFKEHGHIIGYGDKYETEVLENIKEAILSRYCSTEDIKEAVGDKKSFQLSSGGDIGMMAEEAYINGFNNCRKEILAALKIGEES